MASTDSITIIVPALNEADRLAGAVATVIGVVERNFDDYEILVFDDGSTDGTAAVADALAAEHARVRTFHHDRPHGLGGVIRSGWTHARMRYVMWVDGQGATTEEALERIFAERGKADLVVPYAQNQHERRLLRRVIARAVVMTLNALFGLDLRQYTHLVMCELDVARSIKVRTSSHALQAEALVKMLKAGHSYVQVGVDDNFHVEGGKSKAFRFANVVGVASTFVSTFWDVYIARDYLLAPPGGGRASRGLLEVKRERLS